MTLNYPALVLAGAIAGCAVDPSIKKDFEDIGAPAVDAVIDAQNSDAHAQIFDALQEDLSSVRDFGVADAAHDSVFLPDAMTDQGNQEGCRFQQCPPIFDDLCTAVPGVQYNGYLCGYLNQDDGVVYRPDFYDARANRPVCEVHPDMNLPLCRGAEVLCDPIPGTQSADEPLVLPNTFGSLISSTDEVQVPQGVIDTYRGYFYDNTPTCQPGEEPFVDREWGLWATTSCDPISDCPQPLLVESCIPRPRCEENERAIQCSFEDAHAFERFEDCENFQIATGMIMRSNGINMDPLWYQNVTCKQTPDGQFTSPRIEINCLPIRECDDQERPQYQEGIVSLASCNLGDGQVFAWNVREGLIASCHPTPSCE